MITLQDLLVFLFSSFDDSGIRYCVLRNYQELPEKNIGSDIDILLHEKDFSHALDLLTRLDIRITGMVCRSYVKSIFLDGVRHGQNDNSLQIDFATSLSWKGLPYLQVQQVLDAVVSFHDRSEIRIPAKHHEAIISFFSSYLVGGWIKDRYQSFVRNVFNDSQELVIAELAGWAGQALASRLVDAVHDDRRDDLMRMLPQIKWRLAVYHARQKPITTLLGVILYYRSELEIRYTSKYICEICILGMDGAGKSTAIKGLLQQLGSCAKEYEVIHLKPQWRRKDGEDITVCSNPHALEPRGKLTSVLKLLTWVCLYHWRRIFHGHKNSTLVIWDRYIHDILVDPRRYRMDVSRLLLRRIVGLAPRLDAIIVLDVPVSVARTRKTEVSEEENERQFDAYRALKHEFPGIVLIDASGTSQEVVAACESVAIEAMVRRLKSQPRSRSREVSL